MKYILNLLFTHHHCSQYSTTLAMAKHSPVRHPCCIPSGNAEAYQDHVQGRLLLPLHPLLPSPHACMKLHLLITNKNRTTDRKARSLTIPLKTRFGKPVFKNPHRCLWDLDLGGRRLLGSLNLTARDTSIMNHHLMFLDNFSGLVTFYFPL